MNDNIDFKELWQRQETEMPDIKLLTKKINKMRFLLRVNRIFMVGFAIYSIGFTLWMWFTFDLAITTHIGLILILAAVLYGAYMPFRTPKLSKADASLNSDMFINELLIQKERGRMLKKRDMHIFFGLMSVAFLFYLIELAGPIAFILTFVWIAFWWFFMAPRLFKRNEAKIDELIQQLKQIKEHLNQ